LGSKTKNKNNVKTIKGLNEYHQYFRSSLIYYINTFSFFISVFLLVIFKFTPIEILIYTLISVFVFYSFSLILISFLVYYDNDSIISIENELKISKWNAFYYLLENNIISSELKKYKKENENLKNDLGIKNLVEKSNINYNSILEKVQNDLEIHNKKMKLLKINELN